MPSEPSIGVSVDGSCFKSSVEMNGLPINCVNGHFANHATSPSSTNVHVPSTTAAQVGNLTNSALEHVNSVAMEHGYDSMLHDSIFPYFGS